MIDGNRPVGILVPTKDGNHAVIGPCCASPVVSSIPIYPINILPYSQTCGICGRALVRGIPGMTLFDGVVLDGILV